MEKGIVFFDIDGTLCRYGEKVPEEVKRSFHFFRAKGNAAFLCTGRSPVDIQPDILELGFDGMIALMGAYIQIQDQVLLNRTIPLNMLAKTWEAMENGKIQAHMLGRKIFARTVYARDLGLGTPVLHSYKDLMIEGKKPEISSIDLDFENVEEIAPLLPILKEHSEFIQYDAHTGQTRLLGVNKSAAIEQVLALRKYQRMRSYAIGDSQNDMEMLEYVDVGIAMGDAPPEVVQCAAWRTAAVEDNGVGRALEHFGLM